MDETPKTAKKRFIMIRVDDNDREAIQAKAKQAGLTVSGWVRSLAVAKLQTSQETPVNQ